MSTPQSTLPNSTKTSKFLIRYGQYETLRTERFDTPCVFVLALWTEGKRQNNGRNLQIVSKYPIILIGYLLDKSAPVVLEYHCLEYERAI